MKIVSIRPVKSLIISSVAGRPRGDPYEGPAGAFLRAERSPKRPAKVQATSPARWATSSSALRFGNRLVLPCGQHLTGQKGPNMGGLGSLCRGGFLRTENFPRQPADCERRSTKMQATSPARWATSSAALRFGNRPALSCGQHLTGQKGPNMGGLGSPTVLSLRGRISRRLGGRLWSGVGFSSACSGLRR